MNEISPKELFSNWSKNKLNSVYYFLGDEKSLKDGAIKKLKDILKPDTFNFSRHSLPGADISSVLSEANTTSVFSDLRMIVLEILEKTKADDISKIAAYVKDPSPDTCFVLITAKRGAASDQIAKNSTDGIIVKFNKLEDFEAQNFLRSQIEKAGAAIETQALQILIEITGTDAAILKNEADKLIAYHHGRKTPINAKNVLESVGFSKDISPFELSNAIQAGNKDKAIEIIDNLMKEGMEPLRIVYTISSALQKLLKVKILSTSGMPTESAHYAAGVSKGQYFYLNKAAINFSKNALIKNMNRCLEAEALFKSSKSKNPAIILKQLIYGILRSK
ncbi:MAG: DNA polymerase III subunit delta [Elusimicrobiota bacterium]|nr:DNA polymerase III subunit delta [Elusimicrobiota bacterium]